MLCSFNLQSLTQNRPPLHTLLRHPQTMSLPQCDKASFLPSTAGKITLRCIVIFTFS